TTAASSPSSPTSARPRVQGGHGEAQLDPGGAAPHAGRLGGFLTLVRARRPLLRGPGGGTADALPAVRDRTRRAVPIVRRTPPVGLPGRVRGGRLCAPGESRS